MTTYLVSLEGSAASFAALEWARGVATAEETIIVGRAWDIPVNTGYDTMGTVGFAGTGGTVDVLGAADGIDPLSAERAAQEFLDRLLAEQADPRLSGRVLMGQAGRAIVELAEETGPDVTIVVGHGESSKASLLLGSTAHYVVHHAKSAVVVVRGELRLPVRRLVVGVDQGHDDDEPDDRSVAALRWAVRLAGVEQIEVSHADFVPAVAAGPIREPGLESDEAVLDDDALLRHAIEQSTDGTGIPPNGAVIVPVVAAGTGAFALIEASRQADLVVIGTRGRSGLLELILGSTSLDVLAHAHCPVTVVR